MPARSENRLIVMSPSVGKVSSVMLISGPPANDLSHPRPGNLPTAHSNDHQFCAWESSPSGRALLKPQCGLSACHA